MRGGLAVVSLNRRNNLFRGKCLSATVHNASLVVGNERRRANQDRHNHQHRYPPQQHFVLAIPIHNFFTALIQNKNSHHSLLDEGGSFWKPKIVRSNRTETRNKFCPNRGGIANGVLSVGVTKVTCLS